MQPRQRVSFGTRPSKQKKQSLRLFAGTVPVNKQFNKYFTLSGYCLHSSPANKARRPQKARYDMIIVSYNGLKLKEDIVEDYC